MLFLRATSLMLSLILVGLAPWNQPAFAAAGDDPASVIATRTGPGETTSQSCGSNGFIMVSFFLGSVLVSSIESGTTCSGGGGGGTSNATAPDVQSQLEQDLLEVQHKRLVEVFLNNLSDHADVFAALSAEEGAIESLVYGETPPDASEADREALLTKYLSELANSMSALEFNKLEGITLEMQLKALGVKLPLMEAEKDAARHAYELTKLVAETSVDVAEARADLELFNKDVEHWEQLIEEGRSSRYVENKLAAARVRSAVVKARLTEVEQREEAKVAAAKSRYDAAERLYDDHVAEFEVLEYGLQSSRQSVVESRARISELESLIAALDQHNQFAGPSAGPFDALNTRGLEFWSRGSYFDIEDTQAGRVQHVVQKELTVGVQARVSERTIVGLAASYSNVENVDQTGVSISTDSDAILVAPYFAYQMSENLAVDAGAVYGHTEVDVTRALAATGSYDSETYGGQVGVSMRHRLSTVIELTGRVGQSYVFTESSGYTDTGGATVASSNSEQATSSLAGRINVTTDPDWRWFATTQLQYQAIDPGNGIDRLHGGLASGLEYDAGSFSVLGQVSRSIFWSNYQATGLTLQVRVPL